MFEAEVSVRRVARHEHRVACSPQGWTTASDLQDAQLAALAVVRGLLGEEAARADDALRVSVDGLAVVFWFDVPDDEPLPPEAPVARVR